MDKKILIASGAVVVVTGASILMYNALKGGQETKLLNDYLQLTEKIGSESMRNNLLSSCDNPQAFADKISSLEADLELLMAQRAALSPKPVVNDGSQPLELSDGDYSKPGSKPLELSDGDYSQPSQKPGSQPLELSDGDYSKPGSKPLELSDGDYGIGSSEMGRMYGLEQELKKKLVDLKSLCEKEKKESPDKKEKTSDGCEGACGKYTDCARYTEDVTEADLKDAHNTCMEECVAWPQETISCLNKMRIEKPNDCVGFLNCELPKYYEEKYAP